MSKYKGQHGGKKGKKNWARPSPPLFGQCPKENVFFPVRCSLNHNDLIVNIKTIISPNGEESKEKLQSYRCEAKARELVVC